MTNFKSGDKVIDQSTGKRFVIKRLETTYGIVDAAVIPLRKDGTPHRVSCLRKLKSLPLSCLKVIE